MWNRYALSDLMANRELHYFALPLMHGFIGIRQCEVGEHRFQLAVISRR